MQVFKRLQLTQTETRFHTSLVKVLPSFSLSSPSVSDAIDQMIEELKENMVPALLLPENAFVGGAGIFTETFPFALERGIKNFNRRWKHDGGKQCLRNLNQL